MLRPTVIKAIPKDDYKLLLEFDNGEKKSFDVTPYIKVSGLESYMINRIFLL